jgi:hypothetical protein
MLNQTINITVRKEVLVYMDDNVIVDMNTCFCGSRDFEYLSIEGQVSSDLYVDDGNKYKNVRKKRLKACKRCGTVKAERK